MRVSASTPMISGSSLNLIAAFRYLCRTVGRINLASLYVLNAAQDHAGGV
jgi:hypothetical protein